jgi:Cu/Ag efflux pump CusA
MPTALAGGVLVMFIAAGGALSFGAIAGLLAVFGIAVRNAITLVSRYRHLERGGDAFGADLVQRATREQSAPVLMTALTTALVFLPIALFGNIAGLEILQPMAIIVLAALCTSTLYTLIGLPAIYLLFGAKREPDLDLLPVTVVGEEDLFEVTSKVRDAEAVKQ